MGLLLLPGMNAMCPQRLGGDMASSCRWGAVGSGSVAVASKELLQVAMTLLAAGGGVGRGASAD